MLVNLANEIMIDIMEIIGTIFLGIVLSQSNKTALGKTDFTLTH